MIPFIDINSGEFLLLVILALVVIGPKRLPEYVAKLRQFVRQARDMAEGAKTQLQSEMGPEFQDIDWRQYDPRQYDPRKIVREALFDDPDADIGAELGFTERDASAPRTGSTPASEVDLEKHAADQAGVGAEAAGVGAEPVPGAPTSHVDNTYHPDRLTPFDDDAT